MCARLRVGLWLPDKGPKLALLLSVPGSVLRATPLPSLQTPFTVRCSSKQVRTPARLVNIMYPPIEPYETGALKVSDIHTLYYEVSGNKTGTPVVFLHGGPGSGTDAKDRSFFNPAKYKIVLFDQRGSGKSNPSAVLEENTTWDLVKDIEKIRAHLGIDKWHVFGGSWGSTLSLAYAQAHPDRVKSLVLRGIFTLRKSELKFFYQEGTSHLFPDAWEEYIAPIPEAERHDMITAYHAQLNSADEETRLNAAKAWSKWESVCLHISKKQSFLDKFSGCQLRSFMSTPSMSRRLRTTNLPSKRFLML
ncbi:hypothetical protein AcV7_006622 [Taiwanofungus camphoratus]|nr:hypothetical protein AcV7_006622 [Antrodia cinnamomea]